MHQCGWEALRGLLLVPYMPLAARPRGGVDDGREARDCLAFLEVVPFAANKTLLQRSRRYGSSSRATAASARRRGAPG
jgi:hypothetical protein